MGELFSVLGIILKIPHKLYAFLAALVILAKITKRKHLRDIHAACMLTLLAFKAVTVVARKISPFKISAIFAVMRNAFIAG